MGDLRFIQISPDFKMFETITDPPVFSDSCFDNGSIYPLMDAKIVKALLSKFAIDRETFKKGLHFQYAKVTAPKKCEVVFCFDFESPIKQGGAL